MQNPDDTMTEDRLGYALKSRAITTSSRGVDISIKARFPSHLPLDQPQESNSMSIEIVF